jgi:hypothetical protein
MGLSGREPTRPHEARRSRQLRVSGRRTVDAGWCGVRERHEDTFAGACWLLRDAGGWCTNSAVMETPRVGRSHEAEIYEYKSLTEVDAVDLAWDPPTHHGFGHRAGSTTWERPIRISVEEWVRFSANHRGGRKASRRGG